MLIKNIYVYDNHGKKELKHALITKNGYQIVTLEEAFANAREIDAQGRYFLMPGLLDTHVHGQGGVDFAELGDELSEVKLQRITKALGQSGLSYALATFVSMPIDALKKSLTSLNDFIKKQTHATPGHTQIVGVHLEGPFISKQCKGAHNEHCLQQSITMEQFKDIIRSAPHITQWKITLAPDLEGALTFIKQTKELEKEGIFVKVFIGHCNPEKNLINQAIEAGAIGFTHLGNACAETCSRHNTTEDTQNPTSHLVQWVLENPKDCPRGIELIVDGLHVSKAFISLIHNRIKDKIVLVTDALGPTGCEDGMYKLGNLAIQKDKGGFYLLDDKGQVVMKERKTTDGQIALEKSLAGSVATLSMCAKNYFEILSNAAINNPMDSLYCALIQNPRISSLSSEAIKALPDTTNCAIFDDKGQLVMSLCHGECIEHTKPSSPTVSNTNHFFHIDNAEHEQTSLGTGFFI